MESSQSWANASVRNLLRNANYIGNVRYGVDDKDRYFEAEGKHEAIVSEELFNQAQSKMSKNKKIPHKKTKGR